MDLRFGLVAIFLILNLIFIWPTSSKSSGSGNQSSKKKKNSTKIQLSSGIATNPFLQQPVRLPSVESNPFLPSHGDNSENWLGGVPQENKSSNIAVFTNAFNNPFLNFDTRVDSGSPNAPGRVTQAPYRPQPSYDTAPNTPAPYRPPSYEISLNTSVPVNNPFIAPQTQNPPKVGPPASGTPLLPDLRPIKIGSTKTKSDLKCDEYVQEIVGATEITSLVGTSSDVIKLGNVCRHANRLVIGGVEANTGEFPHMVALGQFDSDEKFILMCGASLISHTWVLSAAHCTYGPNGSPSKARIGFHRLTDQQSGVTISIQTMIRHPDYNPPAMYADIALVQLAKAVKFGALIRPACLYQQYDTVPTSAWVSGWGVTEFAGDASDRLQKALLDLIDNLACTIQHNSSKEVPHGVTPSMICAGDPRGGWVKDSCQGDSGGPLQVIHPQNLCLFQVIGITSFGQGCAIISMPGVYTRVSHYLSWIENIVWQGQ